jgi:hypothetical protein
LGKALCRERKKRASRQAAQTGKPGAKERKADALSGEKPKGVPIHEAKAVVSPERKTGAATGTRLEPGNRFVIEMPDLDWLPEL